jgi:hypothetical protein
MTQVNPRVCTPPHRQTKFVGATRWTKGFTAAFQSALDALGPEGYKRAWGHPLPRETLQSVQKFAQEITRNE